MISLKSVECYDSTLDTWTLVEEMSVPRQSVGVGVLNGIIYAVGGYSGSYLKSVEAFNPSTGFWTAIADMHLCRALPGDYSSYFFDSLLIQKKIELKFFFRSCHFRWLIVCYRRRERIC